MTTRTPSLLALLSTLAVAFGLACAGPTYENDEEETPAPTAAVKPANWNQQRVTQIAGELAVAVHELRDAVRDDPVSNIGSGQASARHRLLYTLRLLRTESTHLEQQLKAGKGREETRPIYDRLGVLSRDAAEESRKLFLHETLISRITTAGDLWRRLTPYYAGAGG